MRIAGWVVLLRCVVCAISSVLCFPLGVQCANVWTRECRDSCMDCTARRNPIRGVENGEWKTRFSLEQNPHTLACTCPFFVVLARPVTHSPSSV